MFFVAGKVQLSWITRCHNTCTRKLLLPYFHHLPTLSAHNTFKVSFMPSVVLRCFGWYAVGISGGRLHIALACSICPCTWIRVVFSLRQSIYPCWPYARSSRSSIQITKNRCTFTPSISDTCRLSAWAYLPDDENEKISLPTSRRGNHLPAVIVAFANRALCAKQGRRLGIRCCHMVLCSIRSISRNEWISKPINSIRQH